MNGVSKKTEKIVLIGPLLASIFLGLKYGTGDVIAQQVAIGRGIGDEFDKRRAFMFYGFGGYYGIVFYNVVRGLNALPIANPWAKSVVCSLIDGFIHVPMLFLPQFYVFKELVTSPEPRSLSEHTSIGISRWSGNFWSDTTASAGVFVPLGIINFRFVSLRFRVPFLACTTIIFPIILSTTRGASDYANEKELPLVASKGGHQC
jgi:hypothetical protein